MSGPTDPGSENEESDSTWESAGFDEAAMHAWQLGNHSMRSAIEWRAVGVGDPSEASEWVLAGVGPSLVEEWRKQELTAADARQWYELGLEPTVSLRYIREGRTISKLRRKVVTKAAPPRDPVPRYISDDLRDRFYQRGVDWRTALTYLRVRWTDSVAIEWASRGIDAQDAKAWYELGLEPHEGKDLWNKRVRGIDTLVSWWRLGIPFNDVAAWIRLGVSPHEASTIITNRDRPHSD